MEGAAQILGPCRILLPADVVSLVSSQFLLFSIKEPVFGGSLDAYNQAKNNLYPVHETKRKLDVLVDISNPSP
jgi:hypothetical protein